MALLSSECIHCGSKEHASSDCPHGIFSSKCIHCGSVDHASDDCPHGIFSSKCIHCGSTEHASDDCPHGLFSSKCIHCGSANHASDDCPHGLFSSGSSSQNVKRPDSSSSSDSSNNDEGNCLGQLIGYGLLLAAAIWFVFAVAVPLIVVNIATITLIAGLTKKTWNKALFSGSVLGSIILVFDYNNGWATKALVENVSFFKGTIPFFFYLNIATGLVAAYFLIRNYLNKKNPPIDNAGEFSKRNLIVMGCLALVGGLTIGGQKYFDTQEVTPTEISLQSAETGTPAFVQTKQGSTLRLRTAASEQAPIVANIPNGASLSILRYDDHFTTVNGEKGKWCQVNYNGTIGWAWEGFLKLGTRYVETDSFTGKWKGYYLSYGSEGEVEEKEPTFTFTITKETNKYRIIVESLTSSKPDNHIGRLRSDKIVVDGKANDFYKYQIPTIELSTNGNLMYKDGGGNIRLKKTQ